MQPSLFDAIDSDQVSPAAEPVILEDGQFRFYPQFFSIPDSDRWFEDLHHLDWQTETLRIAGREILVPRLTAWHGEEGIDYRYSGVDHRAKPWTQTLLQIKSRIEKHLALQCKQSEPVVSFNSVLGNWYRNGQDSVAWHADDEVELGHQPLIASVSLGASRTFQVKHKRDSNRRYKWLLPHGSLLIMQGDSQADFQHQVPKEKHVTESRINLTYRIIFQSGRE